MVGLEKERLQEGCHEIMKVYQDINVYDAALARIEIAFNSFDNILVAFSGGKDSGVLLNLCYDYAKKTNQLSKLAMYHIDYEAQYQLTTDYVTKCFHEYYKEIKKIWVCLPLKAQCSVNMSNEGFWRPWAPYEENIWVRDMPNNHFVINRFNEEIGFDPINDWDKDVMIRLDRWFADKYGSTCLMIGLCASESYDRYIFLTKQDVRKSHSWLWESNDYYSAYPLYDWEVEDIWTVNAKFNYDYNRLYDLYYQAGMGINQMRVASPFNNCAIDTLKYYRVIEPDTWGKLISRVNGVNFGGIYGGTMAMGWRSIKKPTHFSWKEYAEFLLNTLPENTAENYRKRLQVSIDSWIRGGARSAEIIYQLEKAGIDFKRTGKIGRGKHQNEVIIFEEYPDDVQIQDFAKVPSWKRLCICILKNDWFCRYMGFTPNKAEIDKRKKILERYSKL
ncbi:MAG: DUF3440 domain-containing protein [Deferribacteraceae bacterium]|jgi:predicted phosphoadenosine phosphosulfate sulfurtransferase|nr:DUF3440 domain-containing protein [Deferribacteraceae bacterium]